MLKRTFETDEIEAKFWVDKTTGNMHIDINGSIGEIPHEDALQIVLELKEQLIEYQNQKDSFWGKILNREK